MSLPSISFPSCSEIIEDTDAIGISLEHYQAEAIREFNTILLERAERVNLIGPKERIRIWRRHCLESLCYSLLLDHSSNVIDIGSGAGFPGVLLAIMGFNVVMLEPRRNRYLFLLHCLRKLQLTTSSALRERLEDIDKNLPGDQFTARSVASPEALLKAIKKRSGSAILVCRQPETWKPEQSTVSLNLPCPPLDRSGILVQYQTCSE